MPGHIEGQTIFYRTPPTTAWGPTSKTAVDWHLKVENTECNVGLTKNYCTTMSMKKISSIHKLILQISRF